MVGSLLLGVLGSSNSSSHLLQLCHLEKPGTIRPKTNISIDKYMEGWLGGVRSLLLVLGVLGSSSHLLQLQSQMSPGRTKLEENWCLHKRMEGWLGWSLEHPESWDPLTPLLILSPGISSALLFNSSTTATLSPRRAGKDKREDGEEDKKRQLSMQ